MKTGDQVTVDMLPDFEFDADTTLKFQAWAALEAIDEGMSEGDVQLIFGLSSDQLQPFKTSWERQRNLSYA